MSEPTTPSDRIVSRTVDGVTTVDRYDLVLAVVPVAFLLAAGFGLLSSVPLYAAMAVGSLAGVAAVADALFVSPPGRDDSPSHRQEPGD